jgi:glutamate-ammonia-ligase adenylyltransferase
MRPVAGNLDLGERLLEQLRSLLLRGRDWAKIADSIRRMRQKAVHAAGAGEAKDVKTGSGGLRDIEFLVQGLQLYRLARHPEILTGNTLEAIERLEAVGVLPSDRAALLRRNYRFFRQIEHYLQILEDRQTHTLPSRESDLNALARRLFGPAAAGHSLTEEIGKCRQQVKECFERMLSGNT